MKPTAANILQRLSERGISVRAVAIRLGANPGHLRRVLAGQRPGSLALLKSVAEAIEVMPVRSQPRQNDLDRLIDAATHVFFVKRGYFNCAIFAETECRKSGGAKQEA